MKSTSSRKGYIDIFRGICILFVLLGHMTVLGLSEENHRLIYLFHMPAFFILSGFLFKHDLSYSINAFVRHKFTRLIIPAWTLALVCSLPFIILFFTGKSHFSTNEIFLKFIGSMSGYPKVEFNFNSSPIWFLFTLFFVEIMAYSLLSIFHKFSIFVVFLLGVIGILLSWLDYEYSPFNVLTSITACFFFSIGMFLNKYKVWVENLSKIYMLILSFIFFGIFSILSVHATSIEMANNLIGEDFHSVLINSLSAISASLGLFFLSGFLDNNLKIVKIISWFGVNTIFIIGFDYYSNDIVVFFSSHLHIDSLAFKFLFKTSIIAVIIFVFSKIPYLNDIIRGKGV